MNNYIAKINEIFLSSVPAAVSVDGPVGKPQWLEKFFQEFPVLVRSPTVLPIGSMFHGTAINTHTDADVLVLIDEADARATPKLTCSMLSEVLSSKTDGQSVRLYYPSFGEVRLIPALTLNTGDSFQIPATPERWIEAAPFSHENAMQKLGAVGLCIIRAFKTWNVDYAVGLRSFEIETLALRAFEASDSEAHYCFMLLWDEAAKFFEAEVERFVRELGEENVINTRARFTRACGEAHNAWFGMSFDPEKYAQRAMFKFARILDETFAEDTVS